MTLQLIDFIYTALTKSKSFETTLVLMDIFGSECIDITLKTKKENKYSQTGFMLIAHNE